MALPQNITDPGMVNVENQAYPFPPGGYQALPPNFGRLLQASLFAAPIVPPSVQAGVVPSFVEIESQSFILPSLSQGVATPATREVDIDTQNVIRQPVRDFVVTDVGNFELTQANSSITLTVTSVVDADTGLPPTAATTRYRIYVSGAVLTDIGLSIAGRQVIFAGNTSPSAADYVRNIIAFNANSIIVLVTEFGEAFSPTPTVTPAAGDTMSLDTERRNSEVVFDVFASAANVVIDSPPPVAETEVAPSLGFQGNILATSGVVSPFIGSGLNGPYFQGTFEIASQTYGRGLPGNIFP